MTTRDKGITLPAQFPFTDISSVTGFRTTDAANDYTSQNAWRYAAANVQPINFAPLLLVLPSNFTVRGQDANGAFAAPGGDINLFAGIGSVGNASGNVVARDTAGNGGAYNKTHIVLGAYHVWVDAAGRLKIKNSAPAADTDGIVCGFDLVGTAVYDPPSLANGVGATTTIAVAGAVLGDFAIASFSLDLQGIQVTAYVSVANTVTIRFQNGTGGVLDLGSGNLKVKVIKQ